MRVARPALPLLLLLVACASPSTVPRRGEIHRSAMALPAGVLVIETERGDVRVEVTIADSEEARARGLMGVMRLEPNEGMVFLHEEPVSSSFWMKDTLIPLSLAVWGTDQRIASIIDMEPCAEEPCPTYDPGVEWVGAVEVNRGFFDRRGVEVGDAVRLER